MAGSGRFPPWRIPTPMPGWQACRPPTDPEEDHRARPIVLENHMEACYEGRRIVLIPECELRAVDVDAEPEGGSPSSSGSRQDGARSGTIYGLGSPQYWRVLHEEKG